MSLLAALIAKNSHIWIEIYFIFLKKCRRLRLDGVFNNKFGPH